MSDTLQEAASVTANGSFNPIRRAGWAVAVCFLLGYIAVPAIAQLIPAQDEFLLFRQTVECSGPLAALLALLAILRCRSGSWRDVAAMLDWHGVKPAAAVKLLLTAPLIALAAGGITLLWQLGAAYCHIEMALPPTTALMQNGSWLQVFMLALTALTAAPVLEEIIFRRTLFGLLKEHIGSWGAGAASAAVFGAMHMSLLQLPGLMFMAAIWQVIYLWKKNLCCSILLHWGNNMIAVAMLLAGRYLGILDL